MPHSAAASGTPVQMQSDMTALLLIMSGDGNAYDRPGVVLSSPSQRPALGIIPLHTWLHPWRRS